MKIIIKQRSKDFIASIDGQPGKWESADTPSMAVGKLINSHHTEFGIQIQYDWRPSKKFVVDKRN